MLNNKSANRGLLWLLVFAFIVLIAGIGLYAANYYNLLPCRTYTAENFGIATVYSETDYNNNGIDDYTDILLGAKKDAENRPTYNGAYYSGGYPPDDIGVCTDVVWRAFKNAGFNLREMLNNDIIARPEGYPNIEQRDKNIDFRRVGNLRVFFDEYALSLSIDITLIEKWQPGDIVIFGDDKHIGIVSDKRNINGQPYIIHNYGQPNREQDFLKRSEVTGHYRFDASMISEDIIVKWSHAMRAMGTVPVAEH
ncbi:MAG: DUF1287 domain-containing protein [Alkaliphilus sp.]|nr:DUF1287 domain-containing protein [Alkaliphilus sp.]